MKEAHELLISAVLEQRPITLFIGQDAWSEPNVEDSVLVMALDKLDRTSELQRGWRGLLSLSPISLPFYEWLADRFEKRAYPSCVSGLSELPWSAVFTTAIDPKLKSLLQGRGREPEVVLTATETPRAVRSTARPPIYFLFGLAGSGDPQTRPPVDRSELNSRRIDHALPILRRMLDTTTTLGLLVIDGFVPGRDWLKVEDILGALGRSIPEQVVWFGGRPQLESDDADDFEAAISSRHIVVENARLATVLAHIIHDERIPEFISPKSQDAGTVTFKDNKYLETTPEERLRVEAVASIVDDSWTADLYPLGPDAEYDSFRRFHGDLGGPRLLVEGVRRKFAIERDFECDLFSYVAEAISDHTSIDAPIIVHGQSGTGKSVALARIVASVRQQRTAAVLYSIGRIPQPQEIIDFCERAEKKGAQVTLIVCDANRDIDPYRELLLSMRSRGRRTVVLGSRYRMANQRDRQNRLNIEAPANLTPTEKEKIRTLFSRLFPQQLNLGSIDEENFLAFLYRVLPQSRQRIASGLGMEANVAEHSLKVHGREIGRPVPNTLLAQRMVEAGFTIGDRTLFDDEQFDALESDQAHATGRIIDFVMVAGSLGCMVPINLLLRAATESESTIDIEMVTKLFGELDLFRWKWADQEKSDLLVLPRLTLEADLICRRRLGGAEKEAERLIELISAVRGSGVDAFHERRFLLNILQQLGADGPRGSRYKRSYVRVARTLTELRLRFGVVHASLMLQESSFRRAAIREDVVDVEERLSLLEEARDSIQSALDGITDGSISAARRTRQNLYVERASLYGFLAFDRARHQAPAEEVWSSYNAARSAIRRAVSVTDNYYPLDIGLWTPADMLKIAKLDELQIAEIEADIYNTLDQVDPKLLPPKQREKFNSRRMMVGSVLQNQVLTEDAYAALESSGSTAGYFLRARDLAPDLRKDVLDIFETKERSRAEQAAEFLKSRLDRISHDERCLSLLLECKWIAVMARRALKGERQPLPADNATLHDLYKIVRMLNHAMGDASRHTTTYLEAVLTWLIDDENGALRMFRELARETEYEDPNRVVRRHVMASAEWEPQRFSGRVEQRRSEGHWVVRVDGINRKIDLLSRDFPHEEIAYGRSLSKFAVAFNFIGPIAEPIGRRR